MGKSFFKHSYCTAEVTFYTTRKKLVYNT